MIAEPYSSCYKGINRTAQKSESIFKTIRVNYVWFKTHLDCTQKESILFLIPGLPEMINLHLFRFDK